MEKKCKYCNNIVDRVGILCKKCIYDIEVEKKVKQKEFRDKYKVRDKIIKENKILSDKLTLGECKKWVQNTIDNKCMVDIYGLLKLIDVYNAMGGSLSKLDT